MARVAPLGSGRSRPGGTTTSHKADDVLTGASYYRAGGAEQPVDVDGGVKTR